MPSKYGSLVYRGTKGTKLDPSDRSSSGDSQTKEKLWATSGRHWTASLPMRLLDHPLICESSLLLISEHNRPCIREEQTRPEHHRVVRLVDTWSEMHQVLGTLQGKGSWAWTGVSLWVAPHSGVSVRWSSPAAQHWG